jgi:hypothetical protein
MPTTLPELTQTIDNEFVETFYSIKAEAIDNILDATPVTAMLRAHGCFTPKVGGKFLTETLKYAVGNETVAVEETDLLPVGKTETETMAIWTWRRQVSAVQYGMFEVQENSGEDAIKSLIAKRLTEARDSMSQKMETDWTRTAALTETGKEIQGLRDVVPPFADRATGTFGRVARSNPWWQANYKQWTAPNEIHMLDDMRNLFNTIGDNTEDPDMILTTQALYELYEDFAENKVQIVQDTAGHLADLGFQILRYKGKALTWTPNLSAGEMMMLNSKYLKVYYDPNMFMDMGPFVQQPRQVYRLAHLFNCMNTTSSQLRRHGLLYN